MTRDGEQKRDQERGHQDDERGSEGSEREVEEVAKSGLKVQAGDDDGGRGREVQAPDCASARFGPGTKFQPLATAPGGDLTAAILDASPDNLSNIPEMTASGIMPMHEEALVTTFFVRAGLRAKAPRHARRHLADEAPD